MQTIQEFLAESDKTEECLVEPGLLPYRGKLILYGPPGVGKSMVVSQLGFDVANGRPWLGMPTRQGRVAYVQCEISRGKFRDRIRTQLKSYPDTPADMFYVLTTMTLTAAARDEEFMQLYGRLAEIGPQLLILDPQYKVMVGDENDNSVMKAFYNIIDWLCTKVGCAVVLVSHTRKARFDDSGGVSDRGFEELKGASRQQDWADTILRLTGQMLRFEKVRNGEQIEPLAVVFDKERFVFEPKSQARRTAEADIMQALEKGPVARMTLMEFLKAHSESTVKRALTNLEGMGAIVVKPMPGNANLKIVEKK